MRTLMLMNAKGGCGKTTLATNLACWFADTGHKVALADFDPQGSSLDWLAARAEYDGVPDIEAIDASREPLRPARGTDYLIMDVPAGVHGKAINEMLRRVHSLIVPVLPSPIDMRAARRFIAELHDSGRIRREQTRVALVANRVRENSHAYHELTDFLRQFDIPLIASLRESKNYLQSAETGLSLFELAPGQTLPDRKQWDAIVDWLESDASQPR